MKHLKSFHMLLECDLSKYKGRYVPLPEDIKLDLEDICQELKDDKFEIRIGVFDINSPSPTNEYEWTNYLLIRTPNNDNIKLQRTFSYKEISEVVERIKDYLKSKGYTTQVRVDKLNILVDKAFSDCRIFIKPLKQPVNEMDDWASPNRLGGDDYDYNYKVEEFIRLYNHLCDTDSPYDTDHDGMRQPAWNYRFDDASHKFQQKTTDILSKLDFTKEECLKLLEIPLRHRGIIRLAVRFYKYKGGSV